MRYLIFLLLPILAACSHTIPSTPEKIEIVKKIQVPAELLQACATLKSDNPSKLEDILLEDLYFIEQYGECRLRHSKLVKTIQEVVK